MIRQLSNSEYVGVADTPVDLRAGQLRSVRREYSEDQMRARAIEAVAVHLRYRHGIHGRIAIQAEVTRAYYEALNARGPAGQVAVALFRAQKRSTRAKQYRGGKYRRAAYDVKNWSLSEISRLLRQHSEELGICWGWKRDPATPGFEWILYVMLPQGQVSFHSASRYDGPDYPGDWDGQRFSEQRIIAYADAVMEGTCEKQEAIPESPKAPESETPAPVANWRQLTLGK